MAYLWALVLIALNTVWLGLVLLGLPGIWLMVASATIVAWWQHGEGTPMFGVVTLADLQGGGNLITPVLRESWLALIAWLALAILGIVFQVRSNRAYVFTREQYVEAWG